MGQAADIKSELELLLSQLKHERAVGKIIPKELILSCAARKYAYLIATQAEKTRGPVVVKIEKNSTPNLLARIGDILVEEVGGEFGYHPEQPGYVLYVSNHSLGTVGEKIRPQPIDQGGPQPKEPGAPNQERTKPPGPEYGKRKPNEGLAK